MRIAFAACVFALGTLSLMALTQRYIRSPIAYRLGLTVDRRSGMPQEQITLRLLRFSLN